MKHDLNNVQKIVVDQTRTPKAVIAFASGKYVLVRPNAKALRDSSKDPDEPISSQIVRYAIEGLMQQRSIGSN